MDRDIKISVVVPVFNLENLIERSVKSICDQTYASLEIILVDDGSTDGSWDRICAVSKYDKRIKTIRKQNGGVTSARLAGVKEATGEWIGFVDGDDYIEADMYENLIKNAIDYDADISHCGYQMKFPNRTDMYYNTGKVVYQNRETGLKDLLEGSFVEPGLWNKLFRKELFSTMLHEDLMDLSISNNEDLLMNYYLFKNSGGNIYEDICPYHYIIRGNSAAMSKISAKKMDDPIRVMETIMKDAENNKPVNRLACKRLCLLLINGATMDDDRSKPFIREHIDRCRKVLRNRKKEFYDASREPAYLLKLILCLMSPKLYGFVHKMYSKIRKTDKKYELPTA